MCVVSSYRVIEKELEDFIQNKIDTLESVDNTDKELACGYQDALQEYKVTELHKLKCALAVLKDEIPATKECATIGVAMLDTYAYEYTSAVRRMLADIVRGKEDAVYLAFNS